MNNRVNYTFVGVLILIGMALMMAFVYWMLKPTENEDVKRYNIYFDESVLGLNIDAPVKYRGISVGKVSQMRINPKNSEQVEVTVTIVRSTPIKIDTAAKLTAQGITGLSYINLSNGGENSPLLEKREGETYPVIKTLPSFFKSLEDSFGNVSSSLTTTLQGTQELLGADNQRQMALLLQRSATVMKKMEDLLDDKTIHHLQSTTANIDAFTIKLNKIMPKVDQFLVKTEAWEKSTADSFDSIMVSYLGLDTSMAKIEKAFNAGEADFRQLNADIVPTLNAVMMDFQELMIQLNEVLEKYKESPSDILYKRQEIQKAPGEK